MTALKAAAPGKGIHIVKGVPGGEVSPKQYEVKESIDLLVPMRDGVQLAMDLLLPDAPGPFPVILTRTPYDKTAVRHAPGTKEMAQRGYAVALQDCRGRFNSDGNFDPFRQEHNDGFDTVEWIDQQAWCDGNVGMMGGSYGGQTQWYAAAQAPKALKAIVPIESPPGNMFLNEPIYGGTMILAMLEWMVNMGRRCFDANAFAKVLTEHQPYFDTLPIARVEDIAGVNCLWWQEMLKHPTLDNFWTSCGYEQHWPNMQVPALNISGWWGLNFLGAPRNFSGMREQAASQEAREGQRLVIGPWSHQVNSASSLSGLEFGPEAVTGLGTYCLRFYDRWLRGQDAQDFDDEAPVHVFVTGANQWWAADTWPLPGTQPSPLYLHSEGKANSHHGDGRVDFAIPGAEPDDHYTADPNDPVQGPWSLHEGPVDDSPASARNDVLCYTSEVLSEALDVVGNIKAVLFAASSAKDCDWHIRLVDVHPDGKAHFMCHGALRARFREGFDRNAFLEPKAVHRFDIDMTATGHRFLPGHRIRIEIASSWFPRFDRNAQTGAENWMTDESEPVIAQQVIKHNQEFPSHIVLPLLVAAPE